MMYGYARVSSTDQNLEIQDAKLRAAGCDMILAEKVSAVSTEGREELARLLKFIRAGDTLVVVRVDRLARSAVDLHNIVADLTRRGVHLMATEQAAINTATAEGKLLLGMLAVVAEFETNIRKDRQMDGIAKAKAKGVYKGRRKSVDEAAVRQLKAGGMGVTAIAKQMNIGIASVYRALEVKTATPA